LKNKISLDGREPLKLGTSTEAVSILDSHKAVGTYYRIDAFPVPNGEPCYELRSVSQRTDTAQSKWGHTKAGSSG
jgi:hypothetical protein